METIKTDCINRKNNLISVSGDWKEQMRSISRQTKKKQNLDEHLSGKPRDLTFITLVHQKIHVKINDESTQWT